MPFGVLLRERYPLLPPPYNTLIHSAITQQDGVCKGVVKDNQGETVIGASVVVKGSTNGTITGLDDDFTLNNVRRGDVIQISYIGYVSQEVVCRELRLTSH